jgi:RNA polymerase sigma factor (sigma-70 family)
LYERNALRIDTEFERLYADEYRNVFGAAFLLCRNREAAEDATQEAFARCCERWARLRDQPWVGGWVMTTALNQVRRGLRRRSAGGAVVEDSESEPSSMSLDLGSGIRALPTRQQEAILLYYGADLPVAQVAEVMGCRQGTVKALLWKGRAALRDYLKAGVDD